MFEVDVIEHPRFCDEFSYLMNRRFLASESLYLFKSHLHSIDISHLFKVPVDLHTYGIALNDNFDLNVSSRCF